MSKLKTPHKKKAMDENTISKPKRSLRSKHKREKSKKTTAIKKERPKKKRKDRKKREYCQAFSSSDIFAQNAASLSGTYDVDLHPYHYFQPSVIDQVG